MPKALGFCLARGVGDECDRVTAYLAYLLLVAGEMVNA